MVFRLRYLICVLAVFMGVLAFSGTHSVDARELSMREARRAIASGRALPPGEILRRVRARVPGELLRAALVFRPRRGLFYRLKMLGRSGRVFVVFVDARTGRILNVR